MTGNIDNRHEKEEAPGSGRSLSTGARVGMALGALVLVGMLAFLLIDSARDEAPQAAPSPETGTACSHLYEASLSYEAGDVQTFQEAVGLAAREAETALERSGVRFGQAERMALELDAIAGDDPLPTTKVERLLSVARGACEDLGRWHA